MSHIVVARLWLDAAATEAFRRREGALEPILLRHAGRLIYDFVPDVYEGQDPGLASRVQVLEFPDAASVRAYLRDPDRLAIAASPDGAPLRTEMISGPDR